MPAECSIGGCGRPVHGLGWCEAHYLRWYRFGDPVEVPPRPVSAIYAALHETRLAPGESGRTEVRDA